MEQRGFSLPYAKLESTKRQHPASLSNSAMVADTAGQNSGNGVGKLKAFLARIPRMMLEPENTGEIIGKRKLKKGNL